MARTAPSSNDAFLDAREFLRELRLEALIRKECCAKFLALRSICGWASKTRGATLEPLYDAGGVAPTLKCPCRLISSQLNHRDSRLNILIQTENVLGVVLTLGRRWRFVLFNAERARDVIGIRACVMVRVEPLGGKRPFGDSYFIMSCTIKSRRPALHPPTVYV